MPVKKSSASAAKQSRKPNPKHVCHFCKKDTGSDDDYCYGCRKNVCQACSVFTPTGDHKPADHIKKNSTVHYFD